MELMQQISVGPEPGPWAFNPDLLLVTNQQKFSSKLSAQRTLSPKLFGSGRRIVKGCHHCPQSFC